jgi:hypothetical protein
MLSGCEEVERSGPWPFVNSLSLRRSILCLRLAELHHNSLWRWMEKETRVKIHRPDLFFYVVRGFHHWHDNLVIRITTAESCRSSRSAWSGGFPIRSRTRLLETYTRLLETTTMGVIYDRQPDPACVDTFRERLVATQSRIRRALSCRDILFANREQIPRGKRSTFIYSQSWGPSSGNSITVWSPRGRLWCSGWEAHQKKNTCQSPRGSNTVNQTHRMKGYRRGFSESSFLLDDLSRLFAFAV